VGKAREPLGSWWLRLRGLGAAARVLTGANLRTPGAIVLAYHDVGHTPSTTEYFVTPSRLRAQLRAALRAGLKLVGLADLTSTFQSGAPVDGMAAVVFDDSLVGVYRHAMPILLEMDIPATLFTVTGALGREPPWWRGAARVMTAGELAEMVRAGFEVGGHTHTHPVLPGLSDAALARELQGSRARLEDLTGQSVDLFAYPFGAHDERVRAAVEAAGYRAAYTFLNGRVTAGLDPYRLPRLNMTAQQRPLRFAYHLARLPASWPDTQLERSGGATA
jgi:peptidoglycan/xylan/chitin deacetylase (PgdA/CDA1 family)